MKELQNKLNVLINDIHSIEGMNLINYHHLQIPPKSSIGATLNGNLDEETIIEITISLQPRKIINNLEEEMIAC